MTGEHVAALRERLRELLLRLAATENDVAGTMKKLARRGGPRAPRRAELARQAEHEADRLTDEALRYSEPAPAFEPERSGVHERPDTSRGPLDGDDHRP